MVDTIIVDSKVLTNIITAASDKVFKGFLKILHKYLIRVFKNSYE